MLRWFTRWGWPARHRPRSVPLRVRGVVAHPGLCATRIDAPRWSMQLTLASWSVVGGWPQCGPLQIAGEADDDHLRVLQSRCAEGAIVVADVLLPLDAAPRATLVAIVGDAMNRSM